jgi:hypothetical protein
VIVADAFAIRDLAPGRYKYAEFGCRDGLHGSAQRGSDRPADVNVYLDSRERREEVALNRQLTIE